MQPQHSTHQHLPVCSFGFCRCPSVQVSVLNRATMTSPDAPSNAHIEYGFESDPSFEKALLELNVAYSSVDDSLYEGGKSFEEALLRLPIKDPATTEARRKYFHMSLPMLEPAEPSLCPDSSVSMVMSIDNRVIPESSINDSSEHNVTDSTQLTLHSSLSGNSREATTVDLASTPPRSCDESSPTTGSNMPLSRNSTLAWLTDSATLQTKATGEFKQHSDASFEVFLEESGDTEPLERTTKQLETSNSEQQYEIGNQEPGDIQYSSVSQQSQDSSPPSPVPQLMDSYLETLCFGEEDEQPPAKRHRVGEGSTAEGTTEHDHAQAEIITLSFEVHNEGKEIVATASWTTSLSQTDVSVDHQEGFLGFFCIDCKLWLDTKEGYEFHRAQHENATYRCSECDVVTKTGSALIAHLYTHLPPRFSCSRCDDVFRWKKDLDIHVAKKHEQNVLPRFECNNCASTFSTRTNLSRHQRLEHDGAKNKLKCPQCDALFSTVTSMRQHERAQHAANPLPQCGRCGKTFSYQSNLTRHQQKCT